MSSGTSMTRQASMTRQRDPRLVDGLIALLLSPFTLLATVSLSADARWGGPLMGLVLGLLFTVPLIWRRARPETAAAVIVVAHLLQLVLFGTFLPADVTAPLVLYAVVVHGEARRHRLWLVVALLGSVAAGLAWGWPETQFPSANTVPARLGRVAMWTVATALVMLVAWFSAQSVRQRQVSMTSLRERAAALERERDRAAELAAEEERSRIAREMHDIIAHSLSVIVVQADGARYLAGHTGHPEHTGHNGAPSAEQRWAAVTEALETIASTSREALAETRRLVGVLRRGDEVEVSPTATLDQIADLVASVSATGVPVSLTESGDRGAHPPLSAGAELAVYRVVQEALTNVVKHAGPNATVAVHLVHTAEAVSVQIADTGTRTDQLVRPDSPTTIAPESPTAPPTEGHGLIGMRERMAAFGGAVHAGPRQGGGFAVRAHLPVTAGPDTRMRREDPR